MKQFYVMSEALNEDVAKRIIKFLNKAPYIEADFNLLTLDNLDGVD